MVGSKIKVYSKSSTESDAVGHLWSSDGDGSYTIAEVSGVSNGTKIVIELNEESLEYTEDTILEGIIKKYSSFVGYPIHLNGQSVNTVEAIWSMDQSKVSDEDHYEFYKYISGAYDQPQKRLSYSGDVPLSIKAVLYVPGSHMEKFGMGRQDPGVSLYSRKVLIQPKSEAILPEWLRFLKGVVDCEDIPLNISRESMQDTPLLRKLNRALTTRVIKWIKEEAKKDEVSYKIFFDEFGRFLKEGICIDSTHRNSLVPLLRYESSHQDGGDVSFEKYIERMEKEQKEIYYLTAPNRALAEASPYYEAFKEKGMEVFFVYDNIDAFVMDNIREFQDKKIVSVEASNLDMNLSSQNGLSEADGKAFCSWMEQILGKNKVIILTISIF